MVPVTGLLIGDAPMILTVFGLITVLAVLGLGFVLGRMWEIRQQEILRQKNEKAGFEIPTAYLSPLLGCGLPIGSRKPHRPQTYLQRLGLSRTKTSDPAHIDL